MNLIVTDVFRRKIKEGDSINPLPVETLENFHLGSLFLLPQDKLELEEWLGFGITWAIPKNDPRYEALMRVYSNYESWDEDLGILFYGKQLYLRGDWIPKYHFKKRRKCLAQCDIEQCDFCKQFASAEQQIVKSALEQNKRKGRSKWKKFI